MVKKLDQSFDVSLPHRVEVDRRAQGADQAADVRVVASRSLHGDMVPEIQQGPKELLFYIHVRQQPVLELTPNDLQISPRKNADVMQ